MVACLMVWNANALMQKWLAYQYIVLPLRHALVVTNLDLTKDPAEVLKVWTSVQNLKFTV